MLYGQHISKHWAYLEQIIEDNLCHEKAGNHCSPTPSFRIRMENIVGFTVGVPLSRADLRHKSWQLGLNGQS